MSKIVVIEKNENGKIELTKEELQQMLDDAYNQGYADGQRKPDTITIPSINEPYTFDKWIPTITYNSVSGLPELKEDT